eukprot:CAMPEP_0185034040 /NCGR_PEP_ID=MMETSP1103-20130426/23545_1 /TAXON_ID=36769 /ORGANISM="Paraphysomonas bandaiensis, Strain Caron Lab Isolate" /LENGTH=408 /DNA_ID=CAMNT_0027570529 /DNA_START=401 /DNA_END=1627 /DNA_ORIENTATION=+
MQLVSKSTLKYADVYILLSGKGLLANVNKDAPGRKPIKLKMGAVFGPIDTFDSETDNPDLIVTYTATITAGTVLRIKYSDLFKAKYGDALRERQEEQTLTPDLKTLRDINHYGNSILTPEMNLFLRKNNLLATNPSDMAFKYIYHGSIGRKIPAQKKEQDVLIILEGSVRVVLERSIYHTRDDGNEDEDGHDGDPGSITCVREGEPAVNFKTQNLPLALLEGGSMLLLDEEMLRGEDVKHTGDVDEEEVGLPSLPNPQKHGRDRRDDSDSYIQHMSLQFDKPTTYLCIPLRRIRNCLQNESYQMNLDIRGQLKVVCSTLADRIEKIKPYLSAPHVITIKNRKPKVVPVDRKVLTCNGDITSVASDLIGTYSDHAAMQKSLLRSASEPASSTNSPNTPAAELCPQESSA